MITIAIIIITSLVSITAFNNPQIMNRFQFNAYRIVKNKEWDRLVMHALLHGSWMHLIINMFVLYSFGTAVEYYFKMVFAGKGEFYFLLLYVTAVIVSSLQSLYKHKDNLYYNAVGASGAVMAVTYAAIFFAPLNMIYLFGIIPIPGILFGLFYLIYSYRMSKKGRDFIAHDVHLWGALYGFVFPVLINYRLIHIFLSQLFG
jgi:membrane associated rhomboid family serine protease